LLAVALLAGACAGKSPTAKSPGPAAAAAAPAAVAAAAPGVPNGPPVELVPAATARPYQLAAISLGSLDRLLANGARLVSQVIPLPMDPAGLRDMLLTQAGLSADVSANVDFASPAGAVVVSIGDKGETGVVLAFAARGPAEAQKLIDALGKPVMVRGPVTLIRSATSGSGWFYRAGNLVVMSDELDALARGAMLALAARRVGADDISADIFPDAIARAHGTDVKTAIAQFIAKAREQQAAEAAKTGGVPLTDEQAWQPVTELLSLVGDAAPIEVGLTADPARGLVIRARMFARAGSRLEAASRDVRPFDLDPSVTGQSASRFMVGATSVGPIWRGILANQRTRLAADKGKGAAAALAYYDAFLAEMAGEQSGAMWLYKEAPYLSGVIASPL
jgi:hypothetical protein